MKVEARAKTNLMLKVLAREEAGFHQIETLFQMLELADLLSVRVVEPAADHLKPATDSLGSAEGKAGTGDAVVVEGTSVTFEVRGVSAGALGAPAGNLVVRAIGAYLRHFHARHGAEGAVPALEVILEKRIPYGAGLGGGSSDAAATLRALNSLASQGWSGTARSEGNSGDPAVREDGPDGPASPRSPQAGSALPESVLLEAAAELGSDVPFFLSTSPLTLGWGRGERLLALPALQPRPVLLVVPPFEVATVDAYAALASHRARSSSDPSGERHTAEPGPALLSLDELAGWETIERLAHNDFHGPIEALHPRLGELRSELTDGGARIALLSGSGSALIGIFADESTRDDMHQALEAQRDLRLIITRTAV